MMLKIVSKLETSNIGTNSLDWEPLTPKPKSP